eukprot:4935199-Alexandrium_andersonii.AAC.1
MCIRDRSAGAPAPAVPEHARASAFIRRPRFARSGLGASALQDRLAGAHACSGSRASTLTPPRSRLVMRAR